MVMVGPTFPARRKVGKDFPAENGLHGGSSLKILPNHGKNIYSPTSKSEQRTSFLSTSMVMEKRISPPPVDTASVFCGSALRILS